MGPRMPGSSTSRTSLRILVLATIATLALAGLARAAAPPRCRGTLSGDARGSFACVAEVRTPDGGRPVFTITPKEAIVDVPVYKPGSFELTAPPAARSYALDDLGMGLASVAVENGYLYTAAKTSSQRGDVTLTLRSVTRDPSRAGAWVVHGAYRARLVPVGGGRTGEVVIEVAF
jgi:hypothetical protein